MLGGLPQLEELGAHVRIQRIAELPGKLGDGDQPLDVGKILKTLRRRDAGGAG
jgi:hypothetical protein